MWYGKAFVITLKLKELDTTLGFISYDEKDIYLNRNIKESQNVKGKNVQNENNKKALIRGVFLRFRIY